MKQITIITQDIPGLLTDIAGALAEAGIKRFSDSGVNLRSVRFIERRRGTALVAICTPEDARARELVRDLLPGPPEPTKNE